MRRSFAAFAAAAALGSAAATQGQPARDAALLLRDPAPVRDAKGLFMRAPAATLVALRGLALRGEPTAETPLPAAGDASGTMRVPIGDRGSAAGYVFTEAGLGALVPRLRAGEARRVAMQPMGEVTTADASEPFTLWVRATLPTGERVTLPAMAGRSVRLPVGAYEAWAQNGDGFAWLRLDVRSGQRSLLAFQGPAQRLAVAASTFVHPLAWPEVDLLRGQREVTLLASALASPLVTFVDGACRGEQTVAGPLTREARAWPPAAAAEMVGTSVPGDLAAGAEATLVSVLRDAAGSFRVLASARVRDGRALLPTPPAGEAWVLLLADGHAPVAAPWFAGAAPPLALTPGQPFAILARDDHNDPIADLAVEYEPDGMPAAAIAANTNAQGRAALGPVRAPGLLRVVDERFVNQEVAIERVPGGELAVRIERGGHLRGTARWPDGSPARGVVITLRDPSGHLRPAARAALTDDLGAFAFGGLREQDLLVLFATATRDGHTWSAKLSRQRAGGDAVELVLRDEDPQLRPDR